MYVLWRIEIHEATLRGTMYLRTVLGKWLYLALCLINNCIANSFGFTYLTLFFFRTVCLLQGCPTYTTRKGASSGPFIVTVHNIISFLTSMILAKPPCSGPQDFISCPVPTSGEKRLAPLYSVINLFYVLFASWKVIVLVWAGIDAPS